MADFGDDAGQQVYDWMFRLAMTRLTRAGLNSSEQALRDASDKLTCALESARDALRDPDKAVPAPNSMPEWAKLDLAEFQELEDFESVRGAIDTKLEECELPHAFYDEGQRCFLLFRTEHAPQVAEAFDDLAGQAKEAAERAAKEIRKQHERGQGKDKARRADRDSEPLEERAQRAREASEAIDAERGIEHDLGRADKAITERTK